MALRLGSLALPSPEAGVRLLAALKSALVVINRIQPVWAKGFCKHTLSSFQ